MRGLVAAWIAGEAIVIWRLVHNDHRMPVPGALAGISALYGALLLAGEAFPVAVPLLTASAWGLNIAALMNVLPAGLAGQISQSATAAAAQAGGAPAPAPPVNEVTA
jgi:hypothetical protein